MAPLSQELRFKKALTTLDALVYRMIEEHRAESDHEGDLLGMLMSATDDGDGEGMTAKQLRDEVMTLVLGWIRDHRQRAQLDALPLDQAPGQWHEKSKRKRPACSAGGSPPSKIYRASNTPSASCKNRCVSIRRHGVSSAPRSRPTRCGGYAIPAGTTIAVCPYALHRNPAYWENPDAFDPDRFLPERSEARSRFAYLPFGDGPRICIGKTFAMMETKIILAMMVARLPICNWPARIGSKLDPRITLRPKNGMPMTLTPRAI